MTSLADRILAGDGSALCRTAACVLPTRPDNLVERPWGGVRLAGFKRLAGGSWAPETRFGESFEIAADPDDPEAAAHPSVVLLPDDSEVELPALLALGAEAILGADFVARHGRRIPLLPKFLDIEELLSVQAHPRGNPEAYVVVEAEPGATLGLGFRRDVDAALLTSRLEEARRAQERLLELVPADAVPSGLVGDLRAAVLPHVSKPANVAEVERIVARLDATCEEMLASMNAVEVRPGDVLDNSIPATRDDAPTAEVHALGNPARREVLLLEVRKPGPSLRAWDHARFPPRPLDIRAAFASSSTRATSADDFRAARRPVPGRPGVEVSITCPYYALTHLAVPGPGEGTLAIPADTRVRTLHVLRGDARLGFADARPGAGEPGFVDLRRGASALLPVGAGGLRVETRASEGGGDAERGAGLLLVTLP